MVLAFAFKLDERTKKVLLVLLALFIIVLLIFGAIYYFIDKYMKREAKVMDNYMYDLCATKIVKTPKEFQAAVNYHERRLLFKNSKWGLRVAIVVSAIVICLVAFIPYFNKDFGALFTEAFKIFPKIKFETVGEINELLAKAGESTRINLPGWAPASIIPSFISKNPDFSNAILWISLIYYVIMVVCFFIVLGAILGYIARRNRAKAMKVEVFNKKLENLSNGIQVPVNRDLNNLPKDEVTIHEGD